MSSINSRAGEYAMNNGSASRLLTASPRVPRMSFWAAAAFLLLIPVALINPAQVMIIVQGLCKIALAAWVGYWIDRCAAPYARPDALLQSMPQDARAIVLNVAFGAASLRRGIIMSAAIIAMAIGL